MSAILRMSPALVHYFLKLICYFQQKSCNYFSVIAITHTRIQKLSKEVGYTLL